MNVIVTANASLKTERDGKIKTNEIDTDIQLSRMNVSFSNLGFFASIFQSFANSAGNMVRMDGKRMKLDLVLITF